MGSNCCQGRGKTNPPTPTRIPKQTKARRRTSERMDLVKLREVTQPLKKPSESHLMGSFSDVFSKILKTTGAPSPTKEPEVVSEAETERTSACVQRETCHTDPASTRVSSLPSSSQHQIHHFLSPLHESPLNVFSLSFSHPPSPCTPGHGLLTPSHFYLFPESSFTSPSERLDISSLFLIFLHSKSSIFLSKSTSLDPSLLEIRSPVLVDLIKAIQLVVYQSSSSFLPISLFDDYDAMLSYSRSICSTDIQSLQSEGNLQVQKLIMTTGSDVYEGKILTQECCFRGKKGQIVITNRKIYVVDEEWNVKECRKIEEITKVTYNFPESSLQLQFKSDLLSISTSDCSQVISLVLKSVK